MHPGQLAISLETVRASWWMRSSPSGGAWPSSRQIPQGTVNAIFRIGGQFAARFPLEPGDPGATRPHLESEARAARELAGRTRFRTPEPVALSEPGAGYPLPWLVQTWLPGVTATDEDPGGSATFAHDVAEFISGVRGISTDGRTFSGSGRGGDLASHDPWMQTCFTRSGHLLDVPRLRRMWDIFRELPCGAGGDVMSHGDLIPGNVLVSGGQLAGVLMSAAWDRLTPRWTWSLPGICSRSARGRYSATISGAMTSTGNAARHGLSSRPWEPSGTTPTATSP